MLSIHCINSLKQKKYNIYIYKDTLSLLLGRSRRSAYFKLVAEITTGRHKKLLVRENDSKHFTNSVSAV